MYLAVLQPRSYGHEEAAGTDLVCDWVGPLLLQCSRDISNQCLALSFLHLPGNMLKL